MARTKSGRTESAQLLRAPVGPCPENIERFAKLLCEGTELDPVSVNPRADGVWAVEGFANKRLQLRAIFMPNGSFIGAWDPMNLCPPLGKATKVIALKEAAARAAAEEG